MSAVKTERNQILNLEAVTGQHFIGEIGPHYYGVRTPKINLCLVVYNRQRWAKDDVPLCVVTNTDAHDDLPAREQIKVSPLVHEMISRMGRQGTAVQHTDMATAAGITELKTWLHEQNNHMRFGGATVLNANAFLQQLTTVAEKEIIRQARAEQQREIAKTKGEIAEITANAGQSLLTAYSHATRPVGVQIWDTQYYNFPE